MSTAGSVRYLASLALFTAVVFPERGSALTRDVFDVAGSVALCPPAAWILVPVDLEPTVAGPSGPDETGVYFERTQGTVTIGPSFGGSTRLDSTYLAQHGCTGSDRARATIRFVDMNAAGFVATNPATWQYKDLRWVTATLSGGSSASGTTPPILQLSAYREIDGGTSGNPAISTCTGPACEFVDPTGAPGQGIGIEELQYISSYVDDTGLDNLILRTNVQATPAGSNVFLSGVPQLTFPTIATAGFTARFQWPVNPIATPIPANLHNCSPERFYTVETSAVPGAGSSSAVDPLVCFQYPDTCNEAGIALYHYHQTGLLPPFGTPVFGWENVTSSLDTTNNLICGASPPSAFALILHPINNPYAVLSANVPCTAEVCDGIDNDCDTQIDDGFGVGQSCSVGIGGCARTGTNVCNAGGGVTCNATPGSPTTETCNGIDDDCNQTVDNGFDVGISCSAGTGQCARNGSRICNAAGTGTVCNATPGSPAAEICDGLDNDCDGVNDDGNPGGGGACATGLQGPCATGALLCAAGSLGCSQTVFPGQEVCNAVDDDCDGTPDDAASDAQTWYADADIDTYGNPAVTQAQCVQPAGYVGNSQDCDDANPALGFCNTPAYPPGPRTFDDPAGAASVTLPNVTTPGDTSISSAPCGAPPQGLFVTTNPICVNIQTTATFSGDAEVCITYQDPLRCSVATTTVCTSNVDCPSGQTCQVNLALEQNLQMVRYPASGSPQVLPKSSQDLGTNVLCSLTPAFSDFAVGVLTDVDQDFVPDLLDNCPAAVNFFQEDGDSDGDGNACDNCRVFANPDQADVNSNGIGNLCECGDQNGDGRVTVADLVAINQAIFNPALARPLCDANNDALCSVADIVAANRKIFGLPAYCSRFPPP
jgi:hypothetical protein